MMELVYGIGALILIIFHYGFFSGYKEGPDDLSENNAGKRRKPSADGYRQKPAGNIVEKGFEKRRESVREQLIPFVQNEVCILDTETTGLENEDEVIEISILDFGGNTLLDTLVKPKCKISSEAAAVHGITKKMLKDAPTWAEVVDTYRDVTNGKTILAFNENFDKRLIRQTCKSAGVPNPKRSWSCVMLAYAEWHGEISRGEYRWQKLEVATKQLNIKTVGAAHRAKSDAMSTLQVLKAIVGETAEEIERNAEELRSRPASVFQKEFAKFFEVKLPPKCTITKADEVLDALREELRENDSAKLEEWQSYMSIVEEISDTDTLYTYDLKKPGKKVLQQALDSLRVEGNSYSEIEEDLDVLVDRLMEIKPELERGYLFLPVE